MVKLTDGKCTVEKTTEEAERLLAFCQRKGLKLWDLASDEYVFSEGKLKPAKSGKNSRTKDKVDKKST